MLNIDLIETLPTKMASYGMLRRVSLVKTDVSKGLGASFIRVKRIGEVGTTLALASNRYRLRRNFTTANLHNFHYICIYAFATSASDSLIKKKGMLMPGGTLMYRNAQV
jgi:hypothetical protein